MDCQQAWASRMETQPTAEKEVPLFVIVINAIGIMYSVNSSKPDCANENSSHLQLSGKRRLGDTTSATGRFIFKKKKSIYM